MNKWCAIGRFTKDPELTTTASGVSVCSFSLAVTRDFKNADGEYEADFINCVAWRNTAEFVCKYFSKGNLAGVVGSIRTRSWDGDDGKKHYVTEAYIDDVNFCEPKRDGVGKAPVQTVPQPTAPAGFSAEDVNDDDLPF